MRRKSTTADFCIIKTMGTVCNKSEVVHLDVCKSRIIFKILAIYSFPYNYPEFSYVNHGKHTIFVGDFNTHSPMWCYSDINEARERVQEFLSSSTFELVNNKEDPYTYLHYNGSSYMPDLLMATADLYKFTK
ncbi:hypothetical protein NPIL_254471 [Nephila pilipes]|uniref:Endonuclease/exonuclease/phosphatase domain-containing protein n=1 Tax=Nephila pilipes TaxID=299642 RepID=A0A8X6QWX6_NEPPI|nr:hypothetical protein NPIL_254471 [Nephila pilipes]